jgi:hypothetical protein
MSRVKSLVTTVCAVASTTFLMISTGRADVPCNYVFSNNASINIDGIVRTISGLFTFDATTDIESSVIFTLSGGDPQYANGTCITPADTDIGRVR